MSTTPLHCRKLLLVTLVGLNCLSGMTSSAKAQCQLQKLLADDGTMFDEFGFSVAINGNIAVVGAPFDTTLGINSGSAYVFEKIDGVWTHTAKLNAVGGVQLDQFGGSVAVSGNAAVIGARLGDGQEFDSGAAYVFEKVGDNWTQTAELSAADGVAGDDFASSVALSGETAVIGARFVDDLVTNVGSAYVFEKVGGVWMQTAKLNAVDDPGVVGFGGSVAVSGDTAVIGASGANGVEFDGGAAYIFEKITGVWTQTARLTASDGVFGDRFGGSVAVNGDTAVVGNEEDDDLGSSSGSAYVFEKVGGVWTPTVKLTAADGTAQDEFGGSVAVSGDTAVIGGSGDDAMGSSSGSVYVFEKVRGFWTQTGKLNAADGAAGDLFGFSVAISGDTMMVGAILDDDLGNASGAVYVFDNGADDCNNNSVPDACDISNGSSIDCNANGIPDDCETETDSDGDGVIDDCDLCPLDNPDDADGDGVCETDDLCPDTTLGLLVDLVGCTLMEGPCCFAGNVCIDGTDQQTCEAFPDGMFFGEGLTCGDPDGDGIVGCSDGCPLDPAKSDPGVCGCGVSDDDGDQDGVADCNDHCLQTPSDVPVNVCGCAEVGACCAAAGGCLDDVERTVCVVIAGIYQGDGSSCADDCSFGDLDGNGTVDLADFAEFTRCFTGAEGESTSACSQADVDGCGAIDLEDFAGFGAAFFGP